MPKQPTLDPWCCTHCGYWQRRFARPETCPVCEDYRHPLPPRGYHFLRQNGVATSPGRRVTLDEPLPGLVRFSTTPQVGIGSCGYLVETPAGNLHFDGCGWYDDAALDQIELRGGVRFLAASHAHVYGAAWLVAERFDPEAVFHTGALPWCRAFGVSYPFDDRWFVTEDLQLIHTGGHTPDHTVLYDAARGRLFCGDALKFTFPGENQTVGVPDTVSTHKAYDAHIPLSHADVRCYLDVFRTIEFEEVVTPWEVVTQGGKRAAMALLERQLRGKPSAEPMPL